MHFNTSFLMHSWRQAGLTKVWQEPHWCVVFPVCGALQKLLSIKSAPWVWERQQSQCELLEINTCHICKTMLSETGVEKPLWGTLEPGPDLHHCTGYPHWPHINPRNHISDCVGTRIPRRNPNTNGENVRTAHRKGLHTWELNPGPSCCEVIVLTTCYPTPAVHSPHPCAPP